MKKLSAVQPYIYPNQLNFKDKPYEAWRNLGIECVRGWYPRVLHNLMFKFDVPTLWYGEARICFVQPVSLYFDTFFAALTHEIIPFIWDCWPCYYDKMERWLVKHRVKIAIFTSKQEMVDMQKRCPEVKMIWCPEAVDCSLYKEGKQLKDRTVDLLEFGRSNEKVISFSNTDRTNKTDILSVKSGKSVFKKINHVCTKVGDKFIYTDEQLYDAMGDAKVTICLPRSMTHPEVAGDIETLTQRYWEAMLSRMVIVGHCPKELEDLIGYNPVVEAPLNPSKGGETTNELILDIITHIEDYQELVDRNRETALRMGDWNVRIAELWDILMSHGYDI